MIIIGKKINGSIPAVADATACRDSAMPDPANRDMMVVICAAEALPGMDECRMEHVSACCEGPLGHNG